MRNLTHTSLFMMACLASLLIGGCTKTVTETQEVDFSLSRHSVAFPAGGGVTSIAVSTSYSWSASTEASWLTLSSDGAALTVTAQANDQTLDVRNAEISVIWDGGSETVEVIQDAGEDISLSVSYGSASPVIDSEGGSFTVRVSCNYDWTAALDKSVDGWTLSTDTEAGTVCVTAQANSGDSLTGTIVISAGSGSFSASETVEVTQISRAQNPFWQFTGTWSVSPANTYYGGEWLGEGVYTSATLSEYDYATAKLSLINYGGTDLRLDKLDYNKEDGTISLPLGFLCGSWYDTGFTYYLYLVCLDINGDSYTTNPTLTLSLSEDGSVLIDGFDESYPDLGYLAINSYLGSALCPVTYYSKAPVTLVKPTETDAAGIKPLGLSNITLLDDAPQGVPARLPKGSEGRISDVNVF